jgi:hypothetical protein
MTALTLSERMRGLRVARKTFFKTPSFLWITPRFHGFWRTPRATAQTAHSPFAGPLTIETDEWHAELDRYRRRTDLTLAERTTVPPCAAADRLFDLGAGAGKSTPDAHTPATFSLWWHPVPTTEETMG